MEGTWFFVYAIWECFYTWHFTKEVQMKVLKHALTLCAACRGLEIDSEGTIVGDVRRGLTTIMSVWGKPLMSFESEKGKRRKRQVWTGNKTPWSTVV